VRKNGIAFAIFFFGFCLSTQQSLAQNRVEKEVCSTGVGMSWKTSEEAKAYLLTSAKREAVGQIFGEFIRSVTKVENYQLSKDDIEAYSVGFIRVEGIPEFYNGKGLGEMCVRMRAYVTDGDLARFKAREVKKKVCVADPRLSLGEVRQIAEKQARVQAVKDFEPKLEKVDDEAILKLIHESKTLDGGFVPDTTTYCTTASGVVYPIELTLVNESRKGVVDKVKVDEPKKEVLRSEPDYKTEMGKVFSGRWRSPRSTMIFDNDKFLMLKGPVHESFIGKPVFRILRKEGNKWIGEALVANYSTGEILLWTPIEIEIYDANTFRIHYLEYSSLKKRFNDFRGEEYMTIQKTD
jgi:hypothetical protein